MGDIQNFGRLLTQTAKLYPNEIGLVWQDQSWTWQQINDRVDAMTAALLKLGVKADDKILVQSRNNNQMFEVCWAVWKAGAVWVPVNFRLTPVELAGLAESSDAKVFIYDQIFAGHADEVCKQNPAVEHVIAIGDARAGEYSYDALVTENMGALPYHAEISRDNAMWLFFTSGTTGRPKAAVLTHGQMSFVVVNHLADLVPGLTRDGAALAVAPLSHAAGLHALVYVARGAKTILMPSERLDVDTAWALVEEHRVDSMFTVPTIVKIMCEDASVDQYDHSSLKWMIYAGAPMYRQDQKFALQKLGKVLVQYFGLGEVTGNITVLPADMHFEDDGEMRIGTCGFPRTGMELTIKDNDGTILDAYKQGEICTRGLAVFAGYYKNPEANASCLKDGWFHTGDLGYLDDAGFLYITGRASDMYISGGSNIYPKEAEEILLTHPAVGEVAVLGVPDPKWGETGVAVVMLADNKSAEEAELIAFLDNKLSKYKWPKRVFFWDEIPKSGYGKVPKHLIRKQLFSNGDLIEGEGA